ncbi:MAG: hypothetical protein FWD86_02335, partial [Firmicutes bacterium]|nr:hypothetical protein [Bacillota bacterium]
PKATIESEIDPDDPETLLKHRLEEYTLFKQASEAMKQIETVDMYFRDIDSSVGQPRFVLKSMDISGLLNALQKIFLRIEQRASFVGEREIIKDRFTVADKIGHIKDIFLVHKSYSFFNLFDDSNTKGEIISTFLAVLELLKHQHITAIQSQIYGDIVLSKSEPDGEAEDAEIVLDYQQF